MAPEKKISYNENEGTKKKKKIYVHTGIVL